jgi:hypothetical protein
MKIKVLLLICFSILGLSGAYSQCTSEKGYYDFPFTEHGLTVTSSGTGSYTYYPFGDGYPSCGVSTKTIVCGSEVHLLLLPLQIHSLSL